MSEGSLGGSVGYPALGSSLGHDLTGSGISPALGCQSTPWNLLQIPSLPHPPLFLPTHVLSLPKNK